MNLGSPSLQHPEANWTHFHFSPRTFIPKRPSSSRGLESCCSIHTPVSTPQTLFFVHQAIELFHACSPSKGQPVEHWHHELGQVNLWSLLEVSGLRPSGVGRPAVLTGSPGGCVCSTLSVAAVTDHTSPQKEADKAPGCIH